jgi:hypothetical protein
MNAVDDGGKRDWSIMDPEKFIASDAEGKYNMHLEQMQGMSPDQLTLYRNEWNLQGSAGISVPLFRTNKVVETLANEAEIRSQNAAAVEEKIKVDKDAQDYATAAGEPGTKASLLWSMITDSKVDVLKRVSAAGSAVGMIFDEENWMTEEAKERRDRMPRMEGKDGYGRSYYNYKEAQDWREKNPDWVMPSTGVLNSDVVPSKDLPKGLGIELVNPQSKLDITINGKVDLLDLEIEAVHDGEGIAATSDTDYNNRSTA